MLTFPTGFGLRVGPGPIELFDDRAIAVDEIARVGPATAITHPDRIVDFVPNFDEIDHHRDLKIGLWIGLHPTATLRATGHGRGGRHRMVPAFATRMGLFAVYPQEVDSISVLLKLGFQTLEVLECRRSGGGADDQHEGPAVDERLHIHALFVLVDGGIEQRLLAFQELARPLLVLR